MWKENWKTVLFLLSLKYCLMHMRVHACTHTHMHARTHTPHFTPPQNLPYPTYSCSEEVFQNPFVKLGVFTEFFPKKCEKQDLAVLKWWFCQSNSGNFFFFSLMTILSHWIKSLISHQLEMSIIKASDSKTLCRRDGFQHILCMKWLLSVGNGMEYMWLFPYFGLSFKQERKKKPTVAVVF